MQSKADRNKIATNIWTARIIPIILAGVAGYATYVVVVLLCVNYLLVKHHDNGAAIPILIVYFILFLLMATSFFRLVYITVWDPPYVTLGPNARRSSLVDKTKARTGSEEDGIGGGEYELDDTRGVVGTEHDPDSPGLELFYTKDVFVSEMSGKPRWCNECKNWKPDRTHHCSSSGRCIRKMDHFCPWVGGPVGENNFKFFTQFTGYTALYCLHILVIMAFYVHQQIITPNEQVNSQFAAILGIGAFFFMFTAGMTGTSIGLTLRNLTQVESLNAKTKIHILAVIKPFSAEQPDNGLRPGSQDANPEITYPLEYTSAAPLASMADGFAAPPGGSLSQQPMAPHVQEPSQPELSVISPNGTSETLVPGSAPGRQGLSERDRAAARTFVVVRTREQGQNPWNLGSPLLNWKTVMGNNVIDWFLPLKRSPCCDHDNPESQFSVGPCVDQLRASNGLLNPEELRRESIRKRSSNGNEKSG